jgi:hypothetical protein
VLRARQAFATASKASGGVFSDDAGAGLSIMATVVIVSLILVSDILLSNPL